MMAEVVANQTPTQAPPATTEAAAAPKQEERVSPKLQVLVQREKQALERERIAKQKEADFENKMKAFSERESKLNEFETLKTTNPMKALELLGLSYQDLTGVALNDGSVPAEVQVKKVEEKFDAYLKAQEVAELQKAEDSKRQAAKREEKVIADFKSDITKFLDEDPKKYEAIKFEQAEEWIFATIDEHYNRTVDPETGIGKILTIAEAADKVEAAFRKKYEDASKLEFFKPKTEEKPQQSNVVKPPIFTTRPPQTRTLTNQLSAAPTKPLTRALTDDERVQKAIAYARGLRP